MFHPHFDTFDSVLVTTVCYHIRSALVELYDAKDCRIISAPDCKRDDKGGPVLNLPRPS